MAKFTERQLHFCSAIATGAGGSDAARAAGYAFPAQEAYRLLRDPRIVAEVERQRAVGYSFINELRATREMLRDAASRLDRMTL